MVWPKEMFQNISLSFSPPEVSTFFMIHEQLLEPWNKILMAQPAEKYVSYISHNNIMY